MQSLQIVVLILNLVAGGPTRTWTDSTGKFSVEAELIEVRDGKAQLRKADGSTLAVPVARLSERDVRYLAALKMQRDGAKPPTAKPEQAAGRPPKPGRPLTAKRVQAAVPQTPSAALSSLARVEFVETPLRNVVDYLKDLGHVEIQLDRAALKSSGVDQDTSVTMKTGKGETLQSALDKILGPMHLEWINFLDEVILVTSQAKAESDEYRETRVYKVPPRTDAKALIKQITEQVAPKDWVENGGPGLIAAWPTGALVISQSQKNHRLLEDRYAGLLQRIVPGAAAPDQRQADKGPAAILNRPVILEFAETPLELVMEYLSDLTKLQIRLDEKALKEMGVTPDAPITISQRRQVNLRTALSMIGVQHGLAWVVTAQGAEITSPSVAKTTVRLVSYDVRDLVTAAGNPQFLVKFIPETIDAKAWTVTGGLGTIEAGQGGTTLEVHQNDHVHEKIEQLLAALRLSSRP